MSNAPTAAIRDALRQARACLGLLGPHREGTLMSTISRRRKARRIHAATVTLAAFDLFAAGSFAGMVAGWAWSR